MAEGLVSMDQTTPRRDKTNIVTILVTVFGALLVALLGILMFGSVSGEEFSPQRFSRRSFFYYQIPVLRIQVWPVSFHKKNSDLAKYLRSNKLLGQTSVPSPRWDIVQMSEVGHADYRGDASVLTSYLQQLDDSGTESWLKWTKDHAALAQELWPLVAHMAQEDMYLLIPDLFEAALRATSKERLAKQLRRIIVSELRAFAKAEDEIGNRQRADQLRGLADDYDFDVEIEAESLPEAI